MSLEGKLWLKAKKDHEFENWNIETGKKRMIKVEKDKVYMVYGVITSQYEKHNRAVLIDFDGEKSLPVILSDDIFDHNLD